MLSNIPSTRVIVAIVFACLTLTSALLIFGVFTYDDLPQAVPHVLSAEKAEKTILELPKYLRIPKINLDSEIEYVGLSPNGEMATPKNIANVGWYEPGIRPGETGSAVIAGHYGWEKGKASAFDELHKLRVGDKIYVEDDSGNVITFVVQENRRYNPEDDAGEVFNSKDGKAHLNLISCEGDWDEASQLYSKRLVVFTDKEEYSQDSEP